MDVPLGKMWPSRFNGLKQTKLETKYGVSSSKNKDLVTQRNLQKVWKIALLLKYYWSTRKKVRLLKIRLVHTLYARRPILILDGPNFFLSIFEKKNLEFIIKIQIIFKLKMHYKNHKHKLLGATRLLLLGPF